MAGVLAIPSKASVAAAWEHRDGEWLIKPRAAFGEKQSQPRKAAAAPADQPGWRGSEGGLVQMEVNKVQEAVEIDPIMGPKLLNPEDGGTTWMRAIETGKRWNERDAADQKVLAYKAAQANIAARKRMEQLKVEAARQKEVARKEAEMEHILKHKRALDKALASGGNKSELMMLRCQWELSKDPVLWTGVTRDALLANHAKKAKGIIYGMEFPWSEETLVEFGAQWLTKAFHAAGTLDASNKVASVTLEQKVKIDAGNNAGKFLFEVTYAKEDPRLHTKLFAKIPFKMTKETQADRISSSVIKQPMDLHEINTYRLMEASFPMATPKFYFGDISCETSNFILITERIPYAEVGEDRIGSKTLKPFEIEGPYDKCKDKYQLRGDPKEYYMLLVKTMAKIGGLDKAGEMLSQEMLEATRQIAPPPSNFPLQEKQASGQPPDILQGTLQNCLNFVSETAQALFPDYVTTEEFGEKFINTMMTWSAYSTEIQHWLHLDPAYVALGHANLNADNAYFWRNNEGKLDCGIIDWGGFAQGCLGHKFWWCFNCADFDQFRDNLSDYIAAFVSTYKEFGGPDIDPSVLKMQILLTTFGNMMFMCMAVPDCFRMCPKKEWETIKDRQDPRVANNINGKSTLRTTLQVLTNCIRVLEEMGSDEVLATWIKDIWVGKFGKTPKSRVAIFGEVAHA